MLLDIFKDSLGLTRQKSYTCFINDKYIKCYLKKTQDFKDMKEIVYPTRPEVSEADPREPKGNKIRDFKVKTSTQKLRSPYVSSVKPSKN